MNHKIRIIVFWITMVIMFATPIYLVARFERVISYGKIYKFRLRPVDPYDPFMGRYISLYFSDEELILNTKDHDNFQKNEWVFLKVKLVNGFAIPEKICREIPGMGDYVKVQFKYTSTRDNGDRYSDFKYPFDHYFMNENYAEKAGMALSRNTRINDNDCYATVSVFHGNAVVIGVFVNDKPIEDYGKGLIDYKEK